MKLFAQSRGFRFQDKKKRIRKAKEALEAERKARGEDDDDVGPASDIFQSDHDADVLF